MTFNHIKSNFNWPKVKRKNINGVRHYVDEEYNIYHSVTRVVNTGKDFSGWYESLAKQFSCTPKEAELIAEYVKRTAGNIGTKLHTLCEDYLNNKPITKVGLLPMAHFENIKPLLTQIDNIRGLEVQMFSKRMGLAGTVDCVADFKNQLTLEYEPCIIDFKTSRTMKHEDWIESYYLQATAYSLMWEENTGECIKDIKILMTAEDGQSGVFHGNRDDYENRLYEKIAEFKSQSNVE